MNTLHKLAAGCLAVCWAFAAASCTDDISLPGSGQTGDSAGAGKIEAYLQSESGKSESTVELRGEDVRSLVRLGLTHVAGEAVDVTLRVAPELVEAYNEEHETSFELFPESQVSLEENGAVLIGPEDVFSDYMALDLTAGEGVVEGQTYLLPVAFDVITEGIAPAAGREAVYLLVKVSGERPDATKPGGFKMVSYIEVNDMNPLNVKNYFLAESGKPFFDIVNIFAANINYDAASGRAYVHFNDNVAHLLANRDKYIAPLQEMGIRVCLTILGNHDRVGVANLSAEGAREFARELRVVVDTYGLDGVDFDDEWSDYPSRPDEAPGFLVPSSELYGRLLIETRRVMPDKLVTLYAYGHTSFYNPIDGKRIGEVVDYAWNSSYLYPDYNSRKDFLGLLPEQWGPYSICLNPDSNQYTGDTLSDAEIQKVHEGGYGVMVWYDLRTDKRQSYVSRFSQVSRVVYGEEVVKQGYDYGKDW